MEKASEIDRFSKEYQQEVLALVDNINVESLKGDFKVFCNSFRRKYKNLNGIHLNGEIDAESLFDYLWLKWRDRVRVYSLFFCFRAKDIEAKLAHDFAYPVFEVFSSLAKINNTDYKMLFGELPNFTNKLAALIVVKLIEEGHITKVDVTPSEVTNDEKQILEELSKPVKDLREVFGKLIDEE